MTDFEDLASLDDDFFTEKSYMEFQKQQSPLINNRLMGKDETIFEALLSKEADFSKSPDNDLIVSTVREYKGHK